MRWIDFAIGFRSLSISTCWALNKSSSEIGFFDYVHRASMACRHERNSATFHCVSYSVPLKHAGMLGTSFEFLAPYLICSRRDLLMSHSRSFWSWWRRRRLAQIDSFSSHGDDVSMSGGGMYGIATGGPGAVFYRAPNSVPFRHAGKVICFPRIEILTL